MGFDDAPEDDEDEGALVTIGSAIIEMALQDAEDAALDAMRARLRASGAEIRTCRLCTCEIAMFRPFGGEPIARTLATGADHVESCPGLTDDQRARLRARA